jgi:beta-barrel assembly-enhancing protease
MLTGGGTMKIAKLVRRALLYAIAPALCVTGIGTVRALLAAQNSNQDEEVQIGQEVFNELKAKAEIIESSPLYDQLNPIANAITRAAQPRYNHPFKFYLVHEPQPNAFSVPGGNVYVTDSLLYFVKNTDELAGTLCHEVSHTIHRDSMAMIEEQKKIMARELGAAILLGPTTAQMLAIALIGRLQSQGYSREVEERADLTGSDVCAGTGYNPWGLVWLFQDFTKANTPQVPEILSNHPDNQHRVDALEQHFRGNPAVFGKFNSNQASATAIVVPEKVPEIFLR